MGTVATKSAGRKGRGRGVARKPRSRKPAPTTEARPAPLTQQNVSASSRLANAFVDMLLRRYTRIVVDHSGKNLRLLNGHQVTFSANHYVLHREPECRTKVGLLMFKFFADLVREL